MGLLFQECPDQLLFFFIFDSGKESLANFDNSLRLIKRELRVHFATGKMTRLAPVLKDGLNILFKRHLCLMADHGHCVRFCLRRCGFWLFFGLPRTGTPGGNHEKQADNQAKSFQLIVIYTLYRVCLLNSRSPRFVSSRTLNYGLK